MRSDDRRVSGLVTGRSSRYLRNAVLLFVGAIVLLGGVLAVVEATYAQDVENFEANDNVHFVTVTATQRSGVVGGLTFGDVRAVAQATSPYRGAQVTTLLQTGFGIGDGGGRDYFLTGVSGADARLLGMGRLRDGTVYSADGPATGSLTLMVPRVEVTSGGMVSGSRSPLTLERASVHRDSPLFVLDHVDGASLFVSEQTFGQVLAQAYGVPWARIRQRDDADRSLGVDLVSGAYVYLPDLDDVKPLARRLDGEGFATAYTFKSFVDLAGALDRTVLIGGVSAGVVLLVAMALGLVNLNTYLRLAHRDMGILKHLGYDEVRVRRVYAMRLAAVALRVLGTSVPAVLLIAAISLRSDDVPYGVCDAALVVACVGIVHLIASRLLLPRHVRLDTLALLRLDREFE